MKFSQQAIWRAVNSEFGSRLVEIAREHTNLVKEMIQLKNARAKNESWEIYKARIQQLKDERDAIIRQFED